MPASFEKYRQNLRKRNDHLQNFLEKMKPIAVFDEYIGRKKKGGVIVDDEQIVSLYWQRNETAIRETETKYDRYLTKIAYNILSDLEDSRESVNDTYLAAWNSMPPHRPGVLSTYLGKITRRISIDRFRYRTREKRRASEYEISLTELGDCVSAGNTTEEAVNVKLLAEAIGIFLRLQPEENRNIFLCRYYFLDSVKDVAQKFGMTESKCKTVLFRTRQALREYLVKEGFLV